MYFNSSKFVVVVVVMKVVAIIVLVLIVSSLKPIYKLYRTQFSILNKVRWRFNNA